MRTRADPSRRSGTVWSELLSSSRRITKPMHYFMRDLLGLPDYLHNWFLVLGLAAVTVPLTLHMVSWLYRITWPYDGLGKSR